MPERAYTDAEIDAAIEALSDPARLEEAQRSSQATRAAAAARSSTRRCTPPTGSAPRTRPRCSEAAGQADPDERVAAVRDLVAEETRVSMLVGVAVGYELGSELKKGD